MSKTYGLFCPRVLLSLVDLPDIFITRNTQTAEVASLEIQIAIGAICQVIEGVI
jgi:hypothetical protein